MAQGLFQQVLNDPNLADTHRPFIKMSTITAGVYIRLVLLLIVQQQPDYTVPHLPEIYRKFLS